MDTLLFHKAERFFSPARTWTAQNSLDDADTGMSFVQDILASLNDSLTGHYPNTYIVLAVGYLFSPLYSKGELWNGPYIALKALLRLPEASN